MKAYWRYLLKSIVVFGITINSSFAVENSPKSTKIQADYRQHRQKTIGELEYKARKILASSNSSSALKTFHKRIDNVDKVAMLMIDRFEWIRISVMNDLLRETGELETFSLSHKDTRGAAEAGDIYEEYINAFSYPIGSESVSESQLMVLKKYYAKLTETASQYITMKGQSIAAMDAKKAREILELCVVMPFLHTPDLAWTEQHIDTLPEWMIKHGGTAHLEAFALRVRRPHTAYVFWRHNQKSSGKETMEGYLGYLLMTGRKLVQKRSYHAGIYCLQLGITLASDKGNSKQSAEIRLELAETLDRIGHPDMAAKEYAELLNTYPNSSLWGKAALCRLKSLYESKDYNTIIQEADKYEKDKRCSAYCPQIQYISWIVHRRLNHIEQSEIIKKRFMKLNPEHPLAADMHFATAMEAMASGNYQEADRLLELIEYRHPKTRVLKKAKKIRERLETISPK